jgi:hypothetical protein
MKGARPHVFKVDKSFKNLFVHPGKDVLPILNTHRLSYYSMAADSEPGMREAIFFSVDVS